MPTPAKPVSVLKYEKRSHRTKKELRNRERAEADLLTGKKIKETKEVEGNKLAHKEFLRLKKLLEEIGKNDDLYSGVINRYCMILAECQEFEKKREEIYRRQETLDEHCGEMEFIDYLKLQNDLSKTLLAYDRQISAKRKMMFDIEKENLMTIASALRSVPKKPEKKTNGLREALNG